MLRVRSDRPGVARRKGARLPHQRLFGRDQGRDGADQLVTLIRETIRPTIWKENGGTAAIRYYNGNLIVTAPRSVHEAIGGPLE